MDFSETSELEEILGFALTSDSNSDLDELMVPAHRSILSELDESEQESTETNTSNKEPNATKDTEISQPTAAKRPAELMVFSKDTSTLSASVGDRHSGLTKILGGLDNAVKINVWVDTTEGVYKMQVDASRTHSVAKVIEVCLKKHAGLGLQPPFDEFGTYELKLADDDGQPDEDFPNAIKKDLVLSTINFSTFVLIQTKQSSEAKQKLKAKVKDHVIIRIHLPDNTYQTHEIHPDTSLQELLRKVGERAKNIDITTHHFRLPSVGHDDTPLDSTLTIRAVNADEISLQKKFDAAQPAQKGGGMEVPDQQPQPQRPNQNFFWTEPTACAYKEFTVMKINKWGIKRERVMGIDGEVITNSIPTKNTTSFLGIVKTTTHGTRRLEQVKSVKPNTSNPRLFTIVFQEGFDLVPTDFIAQDESDAAEIVSKIKYLIKTKNVSSHDMTDSYNK